MTVWVVGNVTEDLVFALDRLPRDGETRIASNRRAESGGKGLNQAVILARAGTAVRLVAPVGQDAAGQAAQALVDAELPGTRLIRCDAPTDQSIIAVAEDGENTIISTAAAALSLTPDMAHAALAGAEAGDTVLVQGNLSAATTAAVLGRARAGGLFTVANPSPIQWDWTPLWPLVDLAIVNVPELRHLSGSDDVPAGCAALRERGVGSVIVTLGARGACRVAAEGVVTVPAVPVAAIDTAGAGDTFCGAYLAAHLRGTDPEAALRAAARAAAITVARAGTQGAFPNKAELGRCLNGP